MILSPQHHHLSSLHHHPNLSLHPKPHLSTLSPTLRPSIFSSLTQPDSSPSPPKPQIYRKHNAKSTALLLHHLSPSHTQEPETPSPSPLLQTQEQEKLKLLELALVRRRTPQFSGSIYLPTSSDLSSSPPPISRLFPNQESEIDNDHMLKQAIEIRRKVTAEVFLICMRSEKFSITYSNNLISFLFPEFIDHVMIQAALLKTLPEFQYSSFNARAKLFIQDSNVIPLIRWLKHNAMTYTQIGKLLCKYCGNLELIRPCIEWLKTIYVKGEFLGAVLLKPGGVLEKGIDQLEEIVRYMESNGVRREWMGFVVSRCPRILSFTMGEVRTRVSFYRDMGMNVKDFGTMVFEYPKSFGQLSLEEMTLKVNYLKEFGLSDEDVGRLLAFRPQLMACSVEERWKPLVKYLYYLGVRRDGMRRILTLKPMVFCIDLETTIAPKVRFLREIGIKEDAIGNMLVKFPTLLTYSLYKKIRPVVIFLLTKAGVSRKDIGKVIALGPELLGCNIAHKLEINVKYFLSLGIRLPQLGEMIADFPMLLRYNLEVLRPKYRYLRRIMIRPLEDLIEFPRFFSYSLDGRIIPRHKVVVENRLNFKLRNMLGCSDQVFVRKVESAVEKRRKFESGEVDVPLSDTEATDDDFIESDQVFI